LQVFTKTAISFLAIALAAFASLDRARGDDILKLATDVWLPYEDISNDAAPGFSVEAINEVLANMGVRSAIRETPWARGLEDVFEGKRDALFTAFWTEERALYCLFPSEPLTSEKWVFFVRSDAADALQFSSLDEIRDRRIGILRGASVTDEFWNFVHEHRNYEEVETDDLNFKKLDKSRLDYVVTSYSNGVLLLKKLDLTDVIEPLAAPIIKEDNLFIMFSKKTVTPEFVERFSATLKAFKTTDAYQAIYDKYFTLARH
jgi:polar amino acid transport system substrate-binding protein